MQIEKLKPWLTPALLFIILGATVAITTLWAHQGEKAHELEKSSQISFFISKNMSREVEYRLQALKLVARQIDVPPSKKEFNEMAKFIQTEYTGFFAINFVSADGVIKIVYPEKQNKPALGHNLLAERYDLKDYLLTAKNTGEPQVSHRILTYQMIYAVVLYVPLFDKSNQFFGWLNGVLYIDHTLIDFMKGANLENVSARVRWHHPANTNEINYNWENFSEYKTTDYQILNQTISIDVHLGKKSGDERRAFLYWATIFILVFLVFVSTFLVSMLTLSKINLNETNKKLSFNNKMLTSLSHDVATPVLALYLAVQVAFEESKISKETANSFKELLLTIEDMIKSIRMLHGYGLGAESIPIEKVLVLPAIQKAISVVEQLANDKKITFEISGLIHPDLAVKANFHTLVNNVLVNILTNSIKYSNPGGKISVNCGIKENCVEIYFTDQGQGISAENIERFQNMLSLKSHSGTKGETGTGLGLLQIRGFMNIYGGQVMIANIGHGTKVTLRFTQA